jgi:hypothetical protein
MMTSSALNKIVTELQNGWNQIQSTLSVYLSAIGSLVRQTQLTADSEVWKALFFRSSLLNSSDTFLLMEYTTESSNDDSTDLKLTARHNRMIGFVESRLTQLAQSLESALKVYD